MLTEDEQNTVKGSLDGFNSLLNAFKPVDNSNIYSQLINPAKPMVVSPIGINPYGNNSTGTPGVPSIADSLGTILKNYKQHQQDTLDANAAQARQQGLDQINQYQGQGQDVADQARSAAGY